MLDEIFSEEMIKQIKAFCNEMEHLFFEIREEKIY